MENIEVMYNFSPWYSYIDPHLDALIIEFVYMCVVFILTSVTTFPSWLVTGSKLVPNKAFGVSKSVK